MKRRGLPGPAAWFVCASLAFAPCAFAAPGPSTDPAPAAQPPIHPESGGCALSGPLGRHRFAAIPALKISIRQCGATEDGTTSDVSAIANGLALLAKNGGGTLLIPCGRVTIPSESSLPFDVPNNSTIEGEKRDCAIITVTGNAELDNLFTATNPNNVFFRDFTCRGNSISNNIGNAGCIYFHGAPSASGVMANFGVIDVALENFRQSYWISVLNESSFCMNNGEFNGISGRSFQGNTLDTASPGTPADVISFRGEYLDKGGCIDGIEVSAPDFDGAWIKRFADFWAGTRNVHVAGGSLRNFGAHQASNVQSFAIMAYASHGKASGADHPAHIWIAGMQIANPYSCGFYGASVIDVHIVGNKVSGQTDPADGIVPSGAICFNHSSGETSRNSLVDNIHGIEILCPNNGTVTVSGNAITSNLTSAKGILIVGDAGCVPVNGSNNTITLRGAGSFGYLIAGNTSAPLNTVSFDGGNVSATYADVYLHDARSGPIVAERISFSNMLFSGPATNAAFAAPGGTATPLWLSNLSLDGTELVTTNGHGFDLTGARNLHINGLRISNMSGGRGRALRLDGSSGDIVGITYSNVRPENQ